MPDEIDFRKRADAALASLNKSLMEAEESADLEVEDQSGALHVSFGDRSKFVISPNAPVRQIWISALATSFKLDWSDAEQDFVLAKTGEKLKALVARLINQQLGEEAGHSGVGLLPVAQLLLQIDGDLPSMESPVLDEDFVGLRTRHNHSRHIDPRYIAFQGNRIADRPALLGRELDTH